MVRTIESARSVYAGVTDGKIDEINIEVGGHPHNEWLTTHASCRQALKAEIKTTYYFKYIIQI